MFRTLDPTRLRFQVPAIAGTRTLKNVGVWAHPELTRGSGTCASVFSEHISYYNTNGVNSHGNSYIVLRLLLRKQTSSL